MKKTLLAVLFATLASVSAFSYGMSSGDIGWDEVSISYSVFDIDGAPKDFKAVTLSGIKSINENVFVSAAYGKGDRGINDSGYDETMFSLGLGYNYIFPSGVNTYAAISFMRIGDSWQDVSYASEAGYVLAAGIRGMVTNDLELRGTAVHFSIYDDQVLEIGIRLRMVENFHIGLDLSLRDYVSSYGVLVSYQF